MRKAIQPIDMDSKNLMEVVTPCFVMDEAEFGRGIKSFRDALSARFENVVIGYSVKTNSLPYAVASARVLGCKAEVVSDDELALARQCGYRWEDIIFNGPMKSKEMFLEAIKNHAVVNIETHSEIDWLEELPAGGEYKVGIRLSIDISKVSPEDADGERDFSRFGFTDDTDEFKKAIERIQAIPQVRLAGLHIHRTSHSRSVRFYRNSVAYASKVIRKYGLDLDYLDVGGGYFGIFPNAPTFEDYAAAIHSALHESGLQHLAVIVEPGNALTASAFTYCSRVIDVKHLPDCRVLTTDGSRNDIDPFFRKSRYFTEILRERKGGTIVSLQIVAGATCLEYDQLFTIENQEELLPGDMIEYKNVGAYTLTLTPNFINFLPRVYAFGDDGLRLVRDKWTAEEFIQKSFLPE